MRSAAFRRPSYRWPNFLSLLVVSGAVSAAYINCDPMLAGREPTHRLAALDARPTLKLPPLPSAAASLPAPGEPSEAAASDAPSASAAAAPAVNDSVLRGKWALAFNVALLERGLARLESIPSYSFTITKQERVGQDLQPPQVMNVKLRHNPFSLYMKWIDGEGPGVRGRQLLYVQGENDNNLLVLPGGIAGRLSGTLSLSLDDPRVTSEARHPPNECGLKHLTETLLGFQRKDLAAGCPGVTCELHADQIYADRPCYLFISSYDSPERSPMYRKAAVFIDKEYSLPVCIRNYTWGSPDIPRDQLDDLTLVEAYAYSEIDLQPESQYAEEDFSRTNPKYRMRR